ncbi:MAG TPA: cytochrome c [Xanthobacteraceae bacterium]|nr:cytochrome c [Xanthobacteraceae bacterium]
MNWRVLSRVLSHVLAVLAAALLWLIGQLPHLSAQEIGDLPNGRHIATTVCAACHMVGKGELYSPEGGAPAFARIAATPGMTSIALSAALLTSHRQMPNIILQPDDRRDVIAYILSLR